MQGGISTSVRRWPLLASFEAAAEVVGMAYGVAPSLITEAAKGRGWRPAEAAREPKKAAIFLAVVLSGEDYSSVARGLGLHKDTVASHCAEVREWADDDQVERNMDVLAAATRVRLEMVRAQAIRSSDQARARLSALQLHMADVFARAFSGLLSDGSSDASSDALTDSSSDGSSDRPKRSRLCDAARAAA